MTDARGDMPTPPDGPGSGGIPRDELDRLFDRDMPRPERRAFTSKLRRDPGALDEVVDTKRMLELLRGPVDTPDLTDRVLRGVAQRRGFLSGRLRRRIRRGRWALAALFVLSFGVVGLAHRLFPGVFTLERRPTPVANLGEAVRRDSIDGRARFVEAVRHLGALELAAGTVCETGEVAFVRSEDRPQAAGFSVTPLLAGPEPADRFTDVIRFESPDPALLALDADLRITACRLELAGVPAGGEVPLGPYPVSDTGRLNTPSMAGVLSWADGVEPGAVPLASGLLDSAGGAQAAYIGTVDLRRDRTLEARLRAAAESAQDAGRSRKASETE